MASSAPRKAPLRPSVTTTKRGPSCRRASKKAARLISWPPPASPRAASRGGASPGASGSAGPPSPKRPTRLGTRTSASERLTRQDVDAGQRLLEGGRARGQLAHARVGGDERAMRFGLGDDGGKGVGGLVAEGGDVDHVDTERVRTEVVLRQQRVGAPEGEDGGVAVVRRDEDGGPCGRPPVAQRPAGRDALVEEAGEHGFRARVLAELDERRDVEPQARHGHGRVHGAAADVGGNLQRLGLAALLEQQERAVRVEHGHALDAIVGDDRDGVDHGAADGQSLHAGLPQSARRSASGAPANSSSSSGSHRRTPPVTPAVLLTILACGGSSAAIMRALPPPM